MGRVWGGVDKGGEVRCPVAAGLTGRFEEATCITAVFLYVALENLKALSHGLHGGLSGKMAQV